MVTVVAAWKGDEDGDGASDLAAAELAGEDRGVIGGWVIQGWVSAAQFDRVMFTLRRLASAIYGPFLSIRMSIVWPENRPCKWADKIGASDRTRPIDCTPLDTPQASVYLRGQS